MTTLDSDTLRQARLLAGWSQEQLGERVGVHYRTVANWERGVARISRASELEELLAPQLEQVRAGETAGGGAAGQQATPEPWATAMLEQGMRTATGGANQSELARRCREVTGRNWPSISAVRRVVMGSHKEPVELELISVLSKVLRRPFDEVSAWVGQPMTNKGPWTPTSAAALLDPEQRALVNRLIEALVRNPGQS